MAIKYYKVSNAGNHATASEIDISLSRSSKAFYFSGHGNIDSADVSKRKASFVSTLIDPKQQLEKSTDVIFPRIPEYKGDNPEQFMPALFHNDVFKPILDRSNFLPDRQGKAR